MEPEAIRSLLRRELLVRPIVNEIRDWAPQGGDPLRRLLDVGASLFIAMQGVRGNYAPAWIGDAGLVMNRATRHITEAVPDDPDMQIAVYWGVLQALHHMIAAAIEEHVRQLAESRAANAP